MDGSPESDIGGSPPPAEEPIRKHHVAPALIALERVDEDERFQLRPPGDVSGLATDIARLGQIFPVDLRLKPPDRFQVICGFRRVAALRFLQREKILARLHTDLSDEDALLMGLAAVLHATPLTKDQMGVLHQRLEEEGRLSPAARDMLSKAMGGDELAPEHVEEREEGAPAPEGEAAAASGEEEPEEEVDADELAQDVTQRLGGVNQDLSLIADVFDSLEPERKKELLEQLRYSAELVAYLEGR